MAVRPERSRAVKKTSVMFKRLLFASLICASSVFGASAEYMNEEFTYSGDTYIAWGKQKNEVYDIAMALNNPAFAGKKITSVSALIATVNGVEDISLWLSSELTLENKKNVPDIASMSVTRQIVELAPEMSGVKISATLPEPYVLTAEPVYVGYSLTVTDNKEPGAASPVIVTPATNSEGFYAHCSKSVIKWKNMVESTEANACIYLTIEGEIDPYCVSIVNMPDAYVLKEENFSAKANLCNGGYEPVSEVEYSYEVAGASKTGKVTFDSPVAPDIMGSSEVELTFEGLSDPGSYDLSVTITKLNGQPNAAVVPNGKCNLYVMPFMPVKRPFIEDFQGTVFGYSPRDIIALQLLNEEFADAVVCASYHFDDPMKVPYKYPIEIYGYPRCSIDRDGLCDTYYGTFHLSHDFGMRDNMLELIGTVTQGDINVAAAWNEEKTDIEVSADARFVRDYSDAYFEIGYLLTASGLSGEGEEWMQYNKYSGDKGYMGTALEIVTTWPEHVPGLIYNDVVVNADANLGLEGSLPFKIDMNQNYHSDYTFIDAGYNELIQDPDNVYVVAFIVDKFTSKIINANKTKVAKEWSKVDTVTESEVVGTVYYDLTGCRVANPGKGIFIVQKRMTDGTTSTSRVFFR